MWCVSCVWEVVKTIKRLSSKLQLWLEGWLGVRALRSRSSAVADLLQRFVLDPAEIDCAGPRLSDVCSTLVPSKGVSVPSLFKESWEFKKSMWF